MCQVSQYYRLALTEVNELNLPADPCDTDPDNRFHDCIRRNVSGQVHSSMKELLPPGRGSAGVAQQCPVGK